MSITIGTGDGDDFIEALANAVGAKKGSRNSKPTSRPPLREAVISTLKDLAAAYGHCPFEVGDLVTPRQGLNLRDAGGLHIVVYVDPDAHHHFTGGDEGHIQTHSVGYGRYLDVRVLSFCHGGGEWCYIPFWMESWQLQPYDPDEDPTYKGE
jgi:hypothetical protein